MDEYIREALLEEQGYTICPLCQPYQVTACDRDCEQCEKAREFERECERDRSERQSRT